MRILVIEDDATTRIMLTSLLQAVGYEVETATGGEEGWRLLVEHNHRLVLTDWEMPELDGVSLCRRIRESSLDRYVYVVLLTSNNETDDIIAGMEAGADDFIAKPFNPEELKVRLRAAQRVLELETRDVTIFALAKLADSRDPETGAHLERIQAYCVLLAKALQTDSPYRDAMTPDFIRMIIATSPLHDIGKVGIPDSILLKPGLLSEDEFAIMRGHTEIGGATLMAALSKFPTAGYLRMAHDIAVAHHERFDGRGYPHKLAGLDIPLAARIVSVADVYDALTSKRIYKDAFTHVVARNIITEESGKQFDAVIVDAFLANEREFVFTKDRINSDNLTNPD